MRHNVDFSNPKILYIKRNLEKTLILKKFEILNNKKSNMDSFSNIYQNFLEKKIIFPKYYISNFTESGLGTTIDIVFWEYYQRLENS